MADARERLDPPVGKDAALIERLRRMAKAERCLFHDKTAEVIDEAADRLSVMEEALLPFAELYGDGVNMNDPLSKWLTVGQLANAAAALAKLEQQE